MNASALFVSALLLLPIPATSAPLPDQKALIKLQITECQMFADKAANIILETMKTKKYDARPVVIAQTAPNSTERIKLMELFARDSLVTDVLVRTAPFGNDMTPEEVSVHGRASIGSLGYNYVLNQCLVEVAVKVGL